MPNHHCRKRFDLSPSEIIDEYRVERDDDFRDAVITAAALVSQADNCVQPVEQEQLLHFVDRHEFLSILPRPQTRQVFERRVCELREREGLAAAMIRLSRVAGHRSAPLVVELSAEIAAADCLLDPRERQVLALIQAVLAGAPLPYVRGESQRARGPKVKQCAR
jgi:tellurite resistance protein